MAYSKSVSAEHPAKTISKMIQSGAQSGIYPRVILLCGKEDFLIDWSKNLLKNALINEASAMLDCAVFSEDEIELSAIINACNTAPMLSQRKLVFVDDSDIFSAQLPKDLDSSELSVLIDYFSDIPESTMLIFSCTKPNKTKAIYKAIAKTGIVYDFVPLDDSTLSGWMHKRFVAAGKEATRADLLGFAKSCGYGDDDRSYNLFNLENDLKKIFSYYDDRVSISLDDMLELTDAQSEQNAFKLLDSAFSGKKGKALEILHASIDSQTPSKETGVVLGFLGLLISQLDIMTEGKERLEAKQNQYDAILEMGVNEYRFKKAIEACRGKSSKQLRIALYDALQLEKELKLGNIDARLGLELLIGEL